LIKFFTDLRYVDPFKVESFQKSRQFLDVYFALANFRGQAFKKLYEFYHPQVTVGRLEKFRENTPTDLQVIGANTLNFRPPSQLGCALGSLGQSLARVKISGAAPPEGRDI